MYSRFNCCYFYFQNNCINIIQTANPRQTKVFNDKGSLNQAQDIAVNTIAPIANPNSLEGHNCPSKCSTRCLTD